MALFVRLLMLAACVPLLLPAGLCVCGAGDGFDVPTAEVGCCIHHHDHHDAPPGEPTPDEHPVPDDDHSPGCPAATAGVDPLRLNGSANQLLDLPPTGSLTVAVAALPPASRPAHRPLAFRPSAPPLYLSHCALIL